MHTSAVEGKCQGVPTLLRGAKEYPAVVDNRKTRLSNNSLQYVAEEDIQEAVRTLLISGENQ